MFLQWFDEVDEWSRRNDRYEVAMHTIGNGLAYAPFDENDLLQPALMEVLNKPGNNELRIGYQIGVSNSRGACFVDPEGKPEFELAAIYKKRAEAVEVQGYSRFADSLKNIASAYTVEAQEHIREAQNDRQELDDETEVDQ